MQDSATDMAITSWFCLFDFGWLLQLLTQNLGGKIHPNDVFVLMPSFWISGFTLLLADQNSKFEMGRED